MSVPAAYLGVIIIWSTTPLAIKWSGETGILFGATGRMVLGAIICLVIIGLMRVKFPWHKRARRSYFAASVGFYASMMMIFWGAQFIPSGLVSVIYGITPIFTSLLTMILLAERKINIKKWIGMILGFIGLCVIFNAELSINSSGMKGLLAVLIGVGLQAFSNVWVKYENASIPALAITGGGLLVALPFYGFTWLLVGETVPTIISTRGLLSIIYLGIFGSVIGFMFLYYIIKHLDVKKVSLITLITPILALILGQNLNGESISVTIWLGTFIVLSGLAIYQFGESV
ncbi:MAG: DMT family transporter [Pseudomonadota bacterium]